MDEAAKNKLIIILIVLTAIFLIISVGSCNDSHRYNLARNKEMAARLDLEEKINKITQEKNAIEQKLNSAAMTLDDENLAHETTKKALLGQASLNQELKEELEKVIKLKETLEEDLKEALLAGKSKTKRIMNIR